MSHNGPTVPWSLRLAGALLTVAGAASGSPLDVIERTKEACEQARAAHPGFREPVDETEALLALNDGPRGYSARIAEETEQLELLRAERERITQTFEKLRAEVDAVRAASVAGHALRAARGALPATWERRRSVARRERAIRDEEYRRLDLQDREARLASEFTEEVDTILAGVRDLPASETARLRQIAENLLTARHDLLVVLLEAFQQRLALLIDADSVERELVSLSGEYRDYVNARVLWLPVQAPLAAENVFAVVDGARRILAPSLWTQSGRALIGTVEERPIPVLLFVTFALLIAGARPIWRRRLREAAAGGGLAHAGEALAYTFLIALSLPVAALAGSWVLARATGAPPLARSFGLALGLVVPLLAEIEVWRAMLLPEGVAERVAGWSKDRVLLLASVFRRLAHVFVPVVLLAVTLRVHSEEFRQAWSGRVLPITLLMALAALGYAVVRVRRLGRAKRDQAEFRESLVAQRRRRVTALVVGGGFIGAATLIVLGYPHTVVEILRRLLDSSTAVLGGVLLWSFTLRILRSRPTAEAAPVPEATVIARLRGLVVFAVVVGLGFIWSPIFPALRYLDTIRLWEVSSATGVGVVTVASVLSFFAIIAGTIVLARFVPGFVEALVPRAAGSDSGVRYAVSTLSQYLVVLVGMLSAFASIKLDWSQLKWLAAGFSVGLGFGLQEIVANFVSGLILLFERPVRVGDIVTVGQTTGTVASINVRATTIRDADRKHLIVPNRDLITHHVNNWTLVDSVIRVSVDVGVAYGSDVDLVEKLLIEAARQCPGVLDDPPPRVVFSRFGESALEFSLQAFVNEVEEFVETKHLLHRAIDRGFRTAGIEIPVPRRDLHLAARQPIPVHVVRRDAAEDATLNEGAGHPPGA